MNGVDNLIVEITSKMLDCTWKDAMDTGHRVYFAVHLNGQFSNGK